jgi:UDP-N-acetyl-D-glucosamine dehydrogenase
LNRLQELEGKIERREAEIAVIGLGYVGLPLALELARAGFRVTGIDLDEARVGELRAGRSYLEDVPAESIQVQVEAGRFAPMSSYVEVGRADCINICVPTPLRRTRDPDVSHIVAAVEEVRKRLRSGQLVVLGSTTYPGGRAQGGGR